MLVFHSPRSLLHDPDRYFRRGTYVQHPEQAQRYTILRDAVAGTGHELREAGDHGLAPILAAHDAGYIELLRTVWSRRAELTGIEDEILTTQFARPQMQRLPPGLAGQVGYYSADTSAAIRAGTWDAVYASAGAALDAADATVGHGHAYALCRPPGHHAYAESAGGFCFLNNSAIAARRLQGGGGRVAILDIDVHHGNGTQGIFYADGDVLTVSVHADPGDYFPYFAGYADERGAGAGEGANLNLPRPQGSPDGVFLNAIEDGLSAVAAFRPAAMVLALGLDASEEDPIGAFRVTTEGFAAAARLVASAGLPTAIIQEGGYLCEALPRNLVAFLAAFEEARGR